MPRSRHDDWRTTTPPTGALQRSAFINHVTHWIVQADEACEKNWTTYTSEDRAPSRRDMPDMVAHWATKVKRREYSCVLCGTATKNEQRANPFTPLSIIHVCDACVQPYAGWTLV